MGGKESREPPYITAWLAATAKASGEWVSHILMLLLDTFHTQARRGGLSHTHGGSESEVTQLERSLLQLIWDLGQCLGPGKDEGFENGHQTCPVVSTN